MRLSILPTAVRLLVLLLLVLCAALPAAAQETEPPQQTPLPTVEPPPLPTQESVPQAIPLPTPEPQTVPEPAPQTAPEPQQTQQTQPAPRQTQPTPTPARTQPELTPAQPATTPRQVELLPPAPVPVDTAAVAAARRDSLAASQSLQARLASLPTPTDALPSIGPVWTPPADADSARASLERVRRLGFTVVRVAPGVSRDVRAWGARLGVRFYIDLPLEYLTAKQMADTLGYVARMADSLRASGADSTLAGIGLGANHATKSQATCDALDKAAQSIRQRLPRATVYYQTAFLDDACSSDALLPLLDLRDADEVPKRWADWKTAHPDRRAALLLGRAVYSGEEGLRADHSPERAARLLETTFASFASDTTQPAFVLLHRWERSDADPYGLLSDDGLDSFSLIAASDAARGIPSSPALAAGAARPGRMADWLRLGGWGVVLMIGLAFSSMLRMRQLTERFFTASGFFREDVRGSRDGLRLQTMVFATLMLAAGAVAVTQLLLILNDTPASGYVRHLIGSALPLGAVVAWLSPVALIAAGWVVLLVIGLAFTLLSRGRHSFTLPQALMIQAWPRWPFVLLLIAALVVPSLPGAYVGIAALALLVVWALIAIAATVHAAITFSSITNTTTPVALTVVLLHPLTWLLLIGLISLLAVPEQARLALDLLMRG